jgi:hypothetical protein
MAELSPFALAANPARTKSRRRTSEANSEAPMAARSPREADSADDERETQNLEHDPCYEDGADKLRFHRIIRSLRSLTARGDTPRPLIRDMYEAT